MRTLTLLSRYLFGLLFIVGGLYHFVNPALYGRMMPPFLPWHLFLIYLSGFFEAALGLLLLVRRYARLAAWGLIALLIAVFPANVHMALNPQLFPELPPAALWLRLPLQVLLVAWAYTLTGGERRRSLPRHN